MFSRYLAVGASFIPAGFILAGFHLMGWVNAVSVGVSLGIGLGTATYAWNLFEPRVVLTAALISEQSTAVASALDAQVLPGKAQFAVLAAVYSCYVFGIGINRPANLVDPSGLNVRSGSPANTIIWSIS